eukprot:1776943-Amphidinium_carterae.1
MPSLKGQGFIIKSNFQFVVIASVIISIAKALKALTSMAGIQYGLQALFILGGQAGCVHLIPSTVNE